MNKRIAGLTPWHRHHPTQVGFVAGGVDHLGNEYDMCSCGKSRPTGDRRWRRNNRAGRLEVRGAL